MGRKSRNTAKTGDVAIYKSRGEDEDEPKKVMDTDNMYNEIDRYHNATNDLQEDILDKCALSYRFAIFLLFKLRH